MPETSFQPESVVTIEQTDNSYSRGGVQGVRYEDYHLDPDQMDSIEEQVFQRIGQLALPNEDIVVVLVDGTSEFAPFGRTSETEAFLKENYDFFGSMQSYEDRSEFLYTLDRALGKIAHVKRLVTGYDPEENADPPITGVEVVDDRLLASDPEEHATLEEIKAFHQIEDFSKIMNVTTNLSTKRGGKNIFSKPYPLVSYKAVFNLAIERGMTNLIAYMNSKAFRSLKLGLGIEYSLVGGKEYHLPDPNQFDGYNHEYLAVTITKTPKNIAAFNQAHKKYPGTQLIANRDVPVLTI